MKNSCRAFFGLGQNNVRLDTSTRYKGRQKDALIETLQDLLRCELFPSDDGLGSCTAKPGNVDSFFFTASRNDLLIFTCF